MSKKTKKTETIPAFDTVPIVISKSLIRKAIKTISSVLSNCTQSRTIDELRVFLMRETSLPIEEIDAALIKMIQYRSILGDEEKGWIISDLYRQFEAVVIGSRKGLYQVENPNNGKIYELTGLESVPVLCGDLVLAKPGYGFDGRIPLAKVTEVIRHAKSTVVCRYVSDYPFGDYCEAMPIDPNCPTPIFVKHENKHLVNLAFSVKLDDELMRFRGKRYGLSGTIEKILGQLNDADTELEVAIERYDLPHEFSDETMLEVAALPENPPKRELKNRVDLRDIGFVTIDGEDARDFDDAVYVKKIRNGWRLLVAIADVSRYVRAASATDKDAQKRSTSVYFPRCVIPMLPAALSNGLCSLNPGVDRAVLTCDMVIGKDGLVRAYQFYPAMIQSKARLTYTSVMAALDGEPEDFLSRGGNLKDIKVFHDLYLVLKEARDRRGAIDFETTETEILCDPEDGHVTAFKKRDHNDAHRMIEEAMLAANTCAADFLIRNKAQGLFRVHDAPDAARLETLNATLRGFNRELINETKPRPEHFNRVLKGLRSVYEKEAIQMAMLRSMQQAVYSPVNIGHFGLSYDAYTHFTSPIRRYPDLLIHRVIRSILDEKNFVPKLLVETEGISQSHAGISVHKSLRSVINSSDPSQSANQAVWSRLGFLTSACERRADEATRDVTAYLKCKYMEEFIGKTFKATVTGMNSAGLYVTLKDIFIEGFVHVSRLGWEYFIYDAHKNRMKAEESSRCFRLGDPLTVLLIGVDVETRRIEFDVTSVGFFDEGFGKRRRRF